MTESDIKQFCIELKQLLEKYNVTIGADITGDLYGVDYDFVLVDNKTNKCTVLDAFSAYIDAYDLDNFLIS